MEVKAAESSDEEKQNIISLKLIDNNSISCQLEEIWKSPPFRMTSMPDQYAKAAALQHMSFWYLIAMSPDAARHAMFTAGLTLQWDFKNECQASWWARNILPVTAQYTKLCLFFKPIVFPMIINTFHFDSA